MQSVASGTLYMVFFSLVSKLLGFFREMIVAYLFGTSRRLDGIVVALDPVGIATALIAAPIARVFLPFYHELKSRSEDTEEFVGSTVNLLILIYLPIVILFLAFPRAIIGIFAPGFEEVILDYTARKLRYLTILVVLNAFYQIFSALLRAERRFKQFAISSSFFNVVAIPVIFFSSNLFGEASYVLGWMAGQLTIVSLMIHNSRDLFSPTPRVFTVKTRELLRRSLPLMFTTSISVINPIVDRVFASFLPEGRIASLKYAITLVNFVNSIMGFFTLASYTELSERMAIDDREGARDRMRKTIRSSLNVAIPAMFWLVSMSREVTEFIFQRGSFTAESTRLVDMALLGYSLVVFLYPLTVTMNDYLVVSKRFNVLFYISLSSIGLNALFDWIFMRFWEHAGIALSTSAVGFVFFMVRYSVLRKDGMNVVDWKRIGFSCLVSLPALFTASVLDGWYKIALGNALFLASLYASAREEIKYALRKVLAKFNR